MASEIRVDKITSLSGVGTITPSSSGIDITGITTVATLKATTGIVTTLTATTGIVTTLTANTVTSLGAVSGTTGTFSGAVSGTTGTFTGDLTIPDKIVHTGDTDTSIRLGVDTVTVETGGSERIRVDSSGRLGIGQNSPTALLHLKSNAPYITFEDDDNNQDWQIQATAWLAIRDQTNSAERLRIDSSGRLLLGTTTEGNASADDLTIATSGSTGITIRSGTSNAGNIYFSDGTSGSAEYAGYISYSHSTGSLSFGSNDGTERVRIDSSGRLMIATTSTSGISASGDDIIIGSIGDSTARGLTFATTAAASIRWADAGDNAMGRVQYDNSTDVMTFHTSNAIRIRLDSDGGIKFGSDTAAANALDDYEEGTFTPDWQGSNTGGTTTYSQNHASYTKIGDICHVRIYSAISGTSATGDWIMHNLPFVSPNNTNTICTGSCMLDGYNFNNSYSWVVPYKNTNTNDLYLFASGDGSGWDALSISDDTSWTIIGGITYQTQ